MDPRQINHRIEELLRLFSLVDVGDSLIDSYSHGMQQKASLAAALMHDPKVLCSTSRPWASIRNRRG